MDFASRATLIPGTLLTLNLPIKIHPSSDSFVFSDVNLVSNYQSYKEKTIKLLPYHSFYRGHIALKKNEPSFLAIHLKKIQSHKDPHLAALS